MIINKLDDYIFKDNTYIIDNIIILIEKYISKKLYHKPLDPLCLFDINLIDMLSNHNNINVVLNSLKLSNTL